MALVPALQKLDKALAAAAGIARANNARIVYCGVTSPAPGAVAHNPTEYRQKLVAFATAQAERIGAVTDALALTSHDPTRDLDETLLAAIKETSADLVVMASHIPGVADHVFASNAGWLASHAPVSVMVIR